MYGGTFARSYSVSRNVALVAGLRLAIAKLPVIAIAIAKLGALRSGDTETDDHDIVLELGARLRGHTATQRSKKGSEKVLGRVLGKASQKGSEKGARYGFYSKEGF